MSWRIGSANVSNILTIQPIKEVNNYQQSHLTCQLSLNIISMVRWNRRWRFMTVGIQVLLLHLHVLSHCSVTERVTDGPLATMIMRLSAVLLSDMHPQHSSSSLWQTSCVWALTILFLVFAKTLFYDIYSFRCAYGRWPLMTNWYPYNTFGWWYVHNGTFVWKFRMDPECNENVIIMFDLWYISCDKEYCHEVY